MIALFLLFACTKTPPLPAVASPAPPPPSPLADEAIAGVTDPVLQEILLDHWEATARRLPTWATELGDDRYADQIQDPSLDAAAAWNDHLRGIAARAEALTGLPEGELSADDMLTRDLLLTDIHSDLSTDICRFDEWAISPRWNVLSATQQLGQDANVTHAGEAAALLSRFRAYADSTRVQGENLRRGAADGLVANRASLEKLITQLDVGLAIPNAEHPVVTVKLPADVEPDAFRAEATQILDELLRPALVAYRDLLKNELLPKARTGEDEGLAGLPIGADCYAASIRTHTSSNADPMVFHERGLEELARIHDEFRALGAATLGTDDLPTLFERLRTDPELRFTTADEVENTAIAALARAEEAVPKVFGRLPTTPCTVDRIPELQAPYATIAYYRGPAPGDDRPGRYFINVYEPETRPRFEAEVLAFHESVPGHHLQIALQSENTQVPLFRKHLRMTVYVEGWALYTERLSDELGLYSSDLDRLGVLSFDAWRAARLVVDTGIHEYHWTRERAEAFMAENTPLATNNIANEVDRYITTPGQALAYKTGQLEIIAMREQAETELGEAFNLKAFHDTVLGAGPLPMPMLHERIDAWIEASR